MLTSAFFVKILPNAAYSPTRLFLEMHLIDPAEGNSDVAGFYDDYVYWIVMDELDSLGIPVEAIMV